MSQATSNKTFAEGFILSRHVRDKHSHAYLEYWLLTEDGPLCVETNLQKDVFFICSIHVDSATACLNRFRIRFEYKQVALKTFEHEPVFAFYFSNTFLCYKAKDRLKESGIPTYESDIRLADRYLMERFIYGSMACSGLAIKRPSIEVPILVEARCKPSSYIPSFISLSLDIECSEKGELYSIGLATDTDEYVLMIGKQQDNTPSWIHWVDDEKTLLLSLVEKIAELDPDVIIGWNVINFDFRLLIKRAAINKVELMLGRAYSKIHWRDASGESNQGFISMPGRVVIDGIDALKSATYHFDSFSLEFVAQKLLGEGKKTEDVDNRMAAIVHDFKYNKAALAEYNLQDCKLVLKIFEKTNLLQYLTLRSQLTGLELDRIGGSVAAFINVYLPKLHRAGYISPNRPEHGGLASPGGYVMDSKPGLYDHVLVLDFKSLYPSIIRTFNIDPLGLVEGLLNPKAGIPGFKGATFSRDKHFLPDIIKQLWEARDEAKKNKDDARSQAIKILMNSFYGVLGSGGCPFYDTRLASSITMRGQEIMQITAKWIEQEGYEVIYGDTDSTFVWLNGNYNFEQASAVGQKLEAVINQKWRSELRERYDIECALDIEFETYFRRFLMPTIRGSHLGSKKRYAGIKQTQYREEFVFKGLETVRSDWTELAKTFQAKLYAMVFKGEGVEDFIRNVIADTLNGKNDEQLVYRKRLRRKLESYVKTAPPHVKAARFADVINDKNGKPLRYQNKGWISYVMTLDGPQVIEYRASQLDYEHYIDKQIRPVAEGILPFIGLSFESITASQLGLF